MKISKLTKDERRILRCKAFILCENSKSRRKHKWNIALINLLIHIQKVNILEGNRGITVTGGFGFDSNGNAISKRLS